MPASAANHLEKRKKQTKHAPECDRIAVTTCCYILNFYDIGLRFTHLPFELSDWVFLILTVRSLIALLSVHAANLLTVPLQHHDRSRFHVNCLVLGIVQAAVQKSIVTGVNDHAPGPGLESFRNHKLDRFIVGIKK